MLQAVQFYNMGVIMGVVWSNPLYAINMLFQSCSNLKMNDTTGKSLKSCPKNANMVPHVWRYRSIILIFKPQYLKNRISKHGEPQHFFGQHGDHMQNFREILKCRKSVAILNFDVIKGSYKKNGHVTHPRELQNFENYS